MCHSALLDAKFYKFLERIDEDEAARTRAAGCPVCGCRLDSARYPRVADRARSINSITIV
jgi:hypothetical protein